MAPLDNTFDEDDDIPAYNPDTGLTEALPQPASEQPKKRGRRSRAQIEADEANASQFPDATVRRPRRAGKNLDGAIAAVQLAHIAVAKQLNDPDVLLDEKEALALVDAADKLLQYYKVSLSGKAGAFLGLGYAVSMIYGPRAFALYLRWRETGSVIKTDPPEPL